MTTRITFILGFWEVAEEIHGNMGLGELSFGQSYEFTYRKGPRDLKIVHRRNRMKLIFECQLSF